jgi:hypothetical protein
MVSYFRKPNNLDQVSFYKHLKVSLSGLHCIDPCEDKTTTYIHVDDTEYLRGWQDH